MNVHSCLRVQLRHMFHRGVLQSQDHPVLTVSLKSRDESKQEGQAFSSAQLGSLLDTAPPTRSSGQTVYVHGMPSSRVSIKEEEQGVAALDSPR